MPVAKGKNYKALTQKEKDLIVEAFCSGKNIPDIIKEFKTTRRAVPEVLKEYDIYTLRKGRYTLNENYFDEIDSERKAYWLGLIAADACVTETNYFAISLKDRDILEELKKDLNFSGDVYTPKAESGIYYRLNFSSKKICDALRKHGIHERKSKTFDELPKMRRGLIRHFFRGYFDGDGTISSSKSTTVNTHSSFTHDNYQMHIIATDSFCEVIKEIVYEETGYELTISPSKSKGMSYARIFKNKALKDIYWFMYHNTDLYLERKHKKWLQFLSSLEK